MTVYILFSVIVSTLFFFVNSEVCSWGYNLAMSLLGLFLFLLRLVPNYRLGYLKNVVAFSIAATLFLISSILAPLVQSEVLLVLAVFFHELIFFILSLSFTSRLRAFVILTLGILLASCLLCVDLQIAFVVNLIGACLNIFLVMVATTLTYSNINIFYLSPPKISISIILFLFFVFFILFATCFVESANLVFNIVAFSFFLCSLLYAFMLVMFLIFRSNDREYKSTIFSSNEERKYQELKIKFRHRNKIDS